MEEWVKTKEINLAERGIQVSNMLLRKENGAYILLGNSVKIVLHGNTAVIYRRRIKH